MGVTSTVMKSGGLAGTMYSKYSYWPASTRSRRGRPGYSWTLVSSVWTTRAKEAVAPPKGHTLSMRPYVAVPVTRSSWGIKITSRWPVPCARSSLSHTVGLL